MQRETQMEPGGFLFTDHYQLSMAQLYFRQGLHEQPAQFEHFFRSYPDYGSHQAGYCINAGLQPLVHWMVHTRPSKEDLDHLRSLKGRSGDRMFGEDFLRWLGECGGYDRLEVEAIPEGRVVHPEVPLTVVRGPVAIAQILESALLAKLNYETLVATKAARIRQSGRGRPLLEFGMRRAQDGGANAGGRGALIGGADFSSNVAASREIGLPSKGTHAHSMVQLFMAAGGTELDAFHAYAEAYPDDCLLLIDTIDTLQSGLPNAIRVFEDLRRKGHKPVGVRLDSGDLAYLCLQVARELNRAGFPDASIVLSNQLDEVVLDQILEQIEQDAPRHELDPDEVIGRLLYGVGTRLITSEGHPALDGVYKLTAIRKDGAWEGAIKLSETPEKTLNPGRKQVWRLYDARGRATADLLALEEEDIRGAGAIRLRHPSNPYQSRRLEASDIHSREPLLTGIRKDGRTVYEFPGISDIRAQRDRDLERLDYGVKRLRNPHSYHVSLTEPLWNRKQSMIRSAH